MSIKFERIMNPDPDLYDLLTRDITLDFSDIGGGKHSVTIHSLSSFKVSDARFKYGLRLEHAAIEQESGNNILFESGDIDAGMGVKVKGRIPTEWHKEHIALLGAACVSGYPEDRDIVTDLTDNFELCSYIIELSIQLQDEFLSKKKK